MCGMFILHQILPQWHKNNQTNQGESIMLAKMHERREQGLCPFCGKDMSNPTFRDPKSKREYEISGICQSCQDEFFKTMEML